MHEGRIEGITREQFRFFQLLGVASFFVRRKEFNLPKVALGLEDTSAESLSQHSALSVLLNDLVTETIDEIQKLVLVPCRDERLIERRRHVLHIQRPIRRCNTQPAMRRLHIPADVCTRATGERAQLVLQ